MVQKTFLYFINQKRIITAMQETNQNEFTQKDLMQHLLNVAQHTVTREEIDARFSKLDDKIDALKNKIDSQSEQLNSKIDSQSRQLNSKIDSQSEQFNSKIDSQSEQFNSKIDTNFRYLLTTMVALSSVIIGLLVYLR